MEFKIKKAFTLAEIMVVLVVIGVLTCILTPIVANSIPDKNVMKFKKADTTLKNVIHELVTSGKYYCEGDLGIKADCTTYITKNTPELRAYFCQTIADLLSVKENKCWTEEAGCPLGNLLMTNQDTNAYTECSFPIKLEVTEETIKKSKKQFDESCKASQIKNGEEIITTDNIHYFQVSNLTQFGNPCEMTNPSARIYSPPDQFPANYADQNGFDISYKIYCIDIDGNKSNGNCDDIKDICPFGYGIRADGKIIPGERADAWLAKDFQGKDPSEQE